MRNDKVLLMDAFQLNPIRYISSMIIFNHMSLGGDSNLAKMRYQKAELTQYPAYFKYRREQKEHERKKHNNPGHHRKSPVRHRVKSHIRAGSRVTSYVRGKGRTANPFTRRRLLKKEGSTRESMEDYTITFYYSKGRKETIPLAARDADDALNLALQQRKMKQLKPIKIVVKDSVGAILGSIAGKVAGGVSTAIKAFRAQYAKGAKERAELKQLQEESLAEKEAWLERKSQEMLRKARLGNRTAQIWCEQHNIAWEQV